SVALKGACAAIQAARLKNDVIDARSWPPQSQAESWARALLQLGFEPALTSEKLAAWLGQTNGEGDRPGGDPAFFTLMRSTLPDWAGAFRETTRPGGVGAESAGPVATPEQLVADGLRDAIQELLFFSPYRHNPEAADKASIALRTIRAADIAPPG